jgi:hypothetical protein
MRKEFIFITYLMLSSYLLKAQNLAGSLNSKLPKSSISNSTSALPTKTQIPYLTELNQIYSLKESFDSLRSEIKEIQESAQDNAIQDSLLNQVKIRSKGLLAKEAQVLESLTESLDPASEKLRSAADKTLEMVKNSQSKIDEIKSLDELESLLDQNEENLKALTNEWIMPQVEGKIPGNLPENFDPRNGNLPDFYGKGALEQLSKEGMDSEQLFSQAKAQAMGKVRHISEDQLDRLKGPISKLKLDTLGNLELIEEVSESKKFKWIEPNELKGFGLLDKIGFYLWYDPLTSFGEGIYSDAGIFYNFTHQLSFYAGRVFKTAFSDAEGPIRKGKGARFGLRFSKGTWAFQSSISKNQIQLDYPAGFETLDYEGRNWSGELSLVKLIPMGKTLRTSVIASWDPLYEKDRSLSTSPFQLKIGFELFRLKKPFENLNRSKLSAIDEIEKNALSEPIHFDQ